MIVTMTEQARAPAHIERIPIRWGDMDALGHVNNTVYFRYMEQARIGWFERLAADGAWKELGIVIVSTACNFRRALAYPGTVEVRLYTDEPGGSSVRTRYELRREDDTELCADGEAVVVFVDRASGRPVRIPEAVRAQLVGGDAAA